MAPSGDVHKGRFQERDLANAPITVPVDDGFKWEYDIAPRIVATSSPQVIRALVSQGLKSQMQVLAGVTVIVADRPEL